jgi:hypothetical protein
MLNQDVHIEVDYKPKVIEVLYPMDIVSMMLITKNIKIHIIIFYLTKSLFTPSTSSKNESFGCSSRFRRRYCKKI